jgi:hypothetical protein
MGIWMFCFFQEWIVSLFCEEGWGKKKKMKKTSPMAKRKHETLHEVHLPSQTLANTIVVYIEEFVTYLQ